MHRTMLKRKIHRARVTDSDLPILAIDDAMATLLTTTSDRAVALV